MLDKIPNAEEMTALIGQSLYDIWNKLCALIDEKYDMECLWNKGGILKRGLMSINIVVAEKRFVHCTQGKTV